MNKRFAPALAGLGVIFAALLISGCTHGNPTAGSSTEQAMPPSSSSLVQTSGSDKDAITRAVEDHVRNNKGINLAAMDMSVDSVQVNGDQAQASATFRLKQGGTSMAMTYSLTRHANGWLVLSDQPADGEFVHPPTDKVHSGLGNPANPAGASGTMPDFTNLAESQSKNKQK